MKKMAVLFFALGTLASAHAAPAEKYDFSSDASHGVYHLENFSGKSTNGILAEFPVTLPAFERGAYFGGGASSFKWPRLANQLTPWFVNNNDMSTLYAPPLTKNPCKAVGKGAQPQAMFALYQLKSGEYLTVLPLCKDSTMSWLNTSKNGTVELVLGNFGKGSVSGDIPLMTWAKDRDLYRSLRTAWELAMPELEGSTDWRMNKVYPEAFKYLGWCSWEHFKKKIDSDKLVTAAKQIEDSGLPIRWFLVDDGFQQYGTVLQSFAPNTKTFPNGWGLLLSMRKDDKIIIFSTDNGSTGKELYQLKKLGTDLTHQFRGMKRSIYEGGHRVPYIVRWPGKTPAGSTCDATICLNDFMATAAEIAGAELAENAAPDSHNILPLYFGQHRAEDPAVIHHDFNGSYAIRRGDWKLVFALNRKAGTFKRELYNLSHDIKEATDVLGKHPEVAAHLAQLFEAQVKAGRSTEGPNQSNVEHPDWMLPF